jgi:eukaryotic-like serine/threonine-protein kinase
MPAGGARYRITPSPWEGSRRATVTIEGMHPQRLIADRYSLVEPMPGSAADLGWRARDLWSGQLVVVTRVPVAGLVGQELLGARHAIAGEVRVLGGLQHDRLARTIDVVLDADDLWVTSETLPGITLADELARLGAVRPERVARWGRDVADGLAVAHGAGVQHRNLHAGVVGIAEDGGAVVGGFASTVVTPDGLRSGTPVHVAPEVARGADPSPAADVFALGAMLYLAVEGHGPFPATEDRQQLLAAVTAGAVTTPRRAGQLSGPLMRMLHPDPAQRPTAAVVADHLRQLTAMPDGGDSATIRMTASEPAFVGPSSYRPPLPWGAPPVSANPQPPGPESPAAVIDPAAIDPPTRQRMWWVVVTAVAAVLALAGGLLVALGLPSTSDPTGRPAAAPAFPPPIGDPRTADPCSLLNVGSVQRFGRATMIADAGYPQTCLIEISTGADGLMWLWATLGVAEDRAPAGVDERIGQLTISRELAADGMCRRTVVLADRSRVYVTARAVRGADTDLCTVADAGTQTAVLTLSSGSLPRRDIAGPPNALTRLDDVCTLLDQAVLGQVPGLDITRRTPGFAGWRCTWGDNPAFLDDPWVVVAVDRWQPLAGQPVQIGGRSAKVFPGDSNDPGTCEVDLIQRSYTGTSGNTRVELLEITVYLGAQQPTDAACRSARALAEAAAPKLPAGA